MSFSQNISMKQVSKTNDHVAFSATRIRDEIYKITWDCQTAKKFKLLV